MWGALVLLAAAAVVWGSVTGILSLRGSDQQVVQINLPELQGAFVNQSVAVNQEDGVVIYHITDRNNTAVVLFDSKNGLICYQPGGRNICLIQKMTSADLENTHSIITAQHQKFSQLLVWRNETQFSKVYLGIRSENKVDLLAVGEPIDSLCNHMPIYWLQKSNIPQFKVPSVLSTSSLSRIVRNTIPTPSIPEANQIQHVRLLCRNQVEKAGRTREEIILGKL